MALSDPFLEVLAGSDAARQHRRVDVETGDALAVLGPRRPGALDEQDGLTRLGAKLGRHPSQVCQVRLTIGLIDAPDIELPVTTRWRAVPDVEVQAVGVRRI